MGAGAVFADKNQTDLANNIANGLLLLAGSGIKIDAVRSGTPEAQYEISVDPATAEKIDGGGDGSNSSGVAVYELGEWNSKTPTESVVLVYDQTEDPQPKEGYFSVVGIYVRKKTTSSLVPSTLEFDPAGETKSVALTVNSGDEWKAECIGSGFSASPLSGIGPATINVAATENKVEMTRTGKLTVTCRSKLSEVALSQPDVVPPDNLFAQVMDGTLDKWNDGPGGTEYNVGFTPTGTDAGSASPQTFTFKGRLYTINDVADVGGGIVIYMYIGA